MKEMTDAVSRTCGPMSQLDELHGRIAELERSQADLRCRIAGLENSEKRFRGAFEFSPNAIAILDETGTIVSMNRSCESTTGYSQDFAVGRNFASLILGPENTDFNERVVDRVFSGESFSDLPLTFVCRTWEIRRMRSRAYPVTDESNRVTACVLTNVDITDNLHTEAELAAELKKFRALYDVAVAMTAERSLDENLSLVVDKSRELLGGDTSYIALRDEEREEVYMRTLSGIRTEAFKNMRIPIGAGLGGRVALSGKGVIVEDYFQEVGPLLHTVVRAEGLISGIAVPIQVGQVNLGVLYVFNRDKSRFSTPDLDTLSLLGNLAAVEITRKRAERELQRARDDLEKRVTERTADLRGVNRKLLLEIAERERVEAALRQSERMMNNILSASPVGIAYLEQGKLKWTNQIMARMFGYTKEQDYLGKPPAEFYYHEEDFLRARELFRQCVTDAKPAEIEALFVRTDGTTFHGQLKTSTLDPGRPDSGVISTISDVSARRIAEDRVRESEARYRTLVEESFDGIFIQKGGKIAFVNSRLCEMLGYARGELEGRDAGLICREIEETIDQPRSSSSDGNPVSSQFEVTLRRKDGTAFDAEINGRTVSLGSRPAVQVWVRDISERKRAEQALRESEEKYRTIVNGLEAVYYEVDLHGTWTFLNESTARVFGYPKEEMIGRNYREFVDGHAIDECFRAVNRVFRSGKPAGVCSVKVRTNFGLDRHLEFSVTPIKDSSGRITGFRGICRDVTERKREQDELLKIEKLESIGVLAGGIAHDFNNILTAIGGNISYAKLFLKPGDKSYKRLSEAEKAGNRARQLTQRLLTFSKGGSPVKKSVSVSDIIEDSCSFALWGSNVRCEYSIAEDLCAADVDEVQIGQVIANLVINADQAMPDGGIIHITALNLDVVPEDGLPLQRGRYVRISVKDQGTGIPREILPKVFDPYFTTKSEGSGLGLATAYSIVKSHGGLITVESKPGFGTTFHVYVPAAEDCPVENRDTEEKVGSGSGRILLMDDEEAIRDLAGELLGMLGYEVVTAQDGAAAIELYRSAKDALRPFDAVILDMTVPGGMGGKDAIKRLIEIDPDVKAIVSSGYSNDPVMSRYQDHGFSGMVAKPYTALELNLTLKKVLSADRR
ncbi:MAG: PAS domain S-box protein [Desulfomonilaceae bacterium]|nr:PAS domain S-box protein [Desulfomonilaceae bacterium]